MNAPRLPLPLYFCPAGGGRSLAAALTRQSVLKPGTVGRHGDRLQQPAGGRMNCRDTALPRLLQQPVVVTVEQLHCASTLCLPATSSDQSCSCLKLPLLRPAWAAARQARAAERPLLHPVSAGQRPSQALSGHRPLLGAARAAQVPMPTGEMMEVPGAAAVEPEDEGPVPRHGGVC